MNTFSATKSSDEKIRPSQIIGGALGFIDEIGFEMETPSVSSVAKGIGEGFGDVFSLFTDIAGVEGKPEEKPASFPSKGSIEFNKKEAAVQKKLETKEKDAKVRTFYRDLKDEQMAAQMAKDRMWFEEEINDITANISTTEKNELLHYQASYKDKSIYQKAELRRKIIEQRKKADKQQKQASVAETKGPSAMNAALEGGSGSQGGGQANLSFQAAG